MKIIMFAVAAVTAAISLPVAAADTSVDAEAAISTAISADIATRDAINRQLAPVRTQTDLQRLVNSQRPSPLDDLPPLDRAVFVQSLRFGPDGVSTFNSSTLSQLTLGQAYRILALVGAQAHAREAVPGAAFSPMEVVKGYACIGQHTCATNISAACTDNC